MIFCDGVMAQAFYNNTKAALEREEKLLHTHCNAHMNLPSHSLFPAICAIKHAEVKK
jgi:hypothetical protein